MNSSLILIIVTILALVVANSGWGDAYRALWDKPVSFSIGNFNLFSHGKECLTLLEFINDFLMALFFFSVGLEIKREILVGELSTMKKALLPIIGACGGMAIPVLISSSPAPTTRLCYGVAQFLWLLTLRSHWGYSPCSANGFPSA